MPSRTTALIACLAVAAALRPTAPSRLSTTPRRAGAAVADVSDGYLTPQMIRTLRKEVDDRRRRKRLALARVADAETGGDFEDATVAAATEALDASEFFEVAGPADYDVKKWPDVAFALAAVTDAMVVQLRKRKAVLYKPFPPGTSGAVVLRTTGKVSPWAARAPAIRDERGRILGREGDEGFEEEEDGEEAEDAS